ncbi:ATP-binding protein [Spirillospora sp. NPDC048911]|uniref:ATP-binding protein n=1 Tax=Spirillospora sp. NPDC048911 TaxID=3364527 RepID=UPI0037169A75
MPKPFRLRPAMPRPFRWIFSVRAKAAFAAALATLLVFGAGGWWLRDMIRLQWTDEAREKATADASTLTIAAETGEVPDAIFNAELVVVLENGTWFVHWNGPPGAKVVEPVHLRPPVEGLLPDTSWHTRTVSFPEALHSDGRESADAAMGPVEGTHDFAVGVTHPLPANLVRTFTGRKDLPGQQLTVYSAIPTENTETAVATADQFFRWALPVAVVFVGVVAWLVTGRALRPVEAIRSKMNEIGARATGQRVPVPAGGTEITRLARTTNETLDRLERALIQQRRFVADASHELRSPLAGLRSALEIPLVHPDEADWQAVVSSALTDTIRLQNLTDDLLLLASDARPSAEAGEHTDLADLVEEQVAERIAEGAAAPAGGPAFIVTTAGPAFVAGSEVRLGRVVRNLLDNAARYARTEVVATVTVEPGTLTKAETTAPEARSTAPEARTAAPEARSTAPEARTLAASKARRASFKVRRASSKGKRATPEARSAASKTRTLTSEAGTVVLTVTDDGPGIPAADRERVFDRFVRLDAARARATGGAGLGLTIVREIVDGLGGTVHATEAIEGARFVVRLPVANVSRRKPSPRPCPGRP